MYFTRVPSGCGRKYTAVKCRSRYVSLGGVDTENTIPLNGIGTYWSYQSPLFISSCTSFESGFVLL